MTNFSTPPWFCAATGSFLTAPGRGFVRAARFQNGVASGRFGGKPQPTETAPTVVRLVTRQEQAAALRRKADEACDWQRWDDCLAALSAAADLDPEGNRKPYVDALWERAFEGLDERELRAKPW